ncbi:hypothetical protein [Microbacterium sp. PMB16]|uniref:hypothetical protein n=1 Tax=Microbacterium sp. PMB16 TaxID=3120157 RepID=UPI003F4B4190
MSGGAERDSGSANVGSAAESDAQARISEHLEAREGEDSGELLYVGDTPAGGGGADSGAAAAVSVDGATEEAAEKEARSYSSEHNDEPGVGNRSDDGTD